DLRFDMRNALIPLGEEEQVLYHLSEAKAAAEALRDHNRLGRVSICMSHHFWWMGDYSRAIESGRRALAIARDRGDFALEVESNYYLGLIYHVLGDYRQAADFLTRNVECIEGDLIHERFGAPHFLAISSRAWLARILGERGDFQEGIALGQQAVRLAN